MKNLEFMALCGEFLVSPTLAIENKSIRKALAANDDERVRELLESEF